MVKNDSLDKYVNVAYYQEVKFVFSKLSEKQIEKMPTYIQTKFEYWCDMVLSVGLVESRKYKGFYDESLQGRRAGQRSVRLSKAYRLIYIEKRLGEKIVLEILEVNKHEY